METTIMVLLLRASLHDPARVGDHFQVRKTNTLYRVAVKELKLNHHNGYI